MSKPRTARSHNPSLLDVIIALLILFNSGGVDVLPNVALTVVTVYVVLIRILAGLQVSLVRQVRAAALFGGILIANLVITESWSGSSEYAVYLSYVVLGMLLLVAYRRDTGLFALAVYRALIIVAVHGIVAFLVQFLLRDFSFPVGDRLRTIGYLFYYRDPPIWRSVWRNQGVFWEPGVNQMYLNLLLVLAATWRKSLKVALLASTGIITTFSTTGYILLSLVVGGVLHRRSRSSISARIAFISLAPLLFGLAAFNVHDKVTGDFSRSTQVRLFDLYVGATMLQDHPLLGIGVPQQNIDTTLERRGLASLDTFGLTESELEGKGLTNSALFLANAFGVPVFIFLMISLFRQRLITGSRRLTFLVLATSGLSIPIFNTPLITVLMLSGMLRKPLVNLR